MQLWKQPEDRRTYLLQLKKKRRPRWGRLRRDRAAMDGDQALPAPKQEEERNRVGMRRILRSSAHLSVKCPGDLFQEYKSHSVGLWRLMGLDTRDNWSTMGSWVSTCGRLACCSVDPSATQQRGINLKGDLLALGSVPESQGAVCPSELYPEEKRVGKCHFYSPTLAPLTRHFWKPILKLSTYSTCSAPAFFCKHALPNTARPMEFSHCRQPGRVHPAHSTPTAVILATVRNTLEHLAHVSSFSPLGNTGCLLHKAQSTAFKTWRYSSFIQYIYTNTERQTK